jgi:hypothetical protein
MSGREQETPGPTHIESLRSTSDIPTLRDIVETRKPPLVQNGIEEPQSGKPNAQPIVVQQGNQSGHNGRRCRSSASPGDVPHPEEPVSERESGDIGEPLQRRSQKNYVRLRNFKTEICLRDRSCKRGNYLSERSKEVFDRRRVTYGL